MGSRQQGYNHIKITASDLLLTPFEEYNNLRTLLLFKCTDCMNEFNVTGWTYVYTKNGKCCLKCSKKKKVNNPTTRDIFIKDCQKIHGEYYSYNNLELTFSQKEHITVTCPKHGDFKTTGDSHKRGVGCKMCKIKKIATANRSNITEFTLKANKIHNCKYSYTLAFYKNAITNIDIVCPKHGIFKQTPDVHLHGSGCPRCKSSVPITKILNMLDKLELSYATEKTFSACLGESGRVLRFDIFIPQYNLCVEYDGIHHYTPTAYGGCSTKVAKEAFIKQQQNDEIKNIFCNENNINLVRLPYTDLHPDATLQKYIQQELESVRYMYTYNDLVQDVNKIINYIKSFSYTEFAIYGILRGGLPFAVHASNCLDSEFGVIEFQRYDGNSKKAIIQVEHKTKDIPIFLIDDLISSNITMKKSISTLQHKFKKSIIHPIVIFGEENEDNIFFLREHPNQWIVFPYEI